MNVELIDVKTPWKVRLAKELSKIDDVDMGGLKYAGRIEPTEYNLLQITVCLLWLRKQGYRQTISKLRTSYGLKHDVEADMGQYVSNGAFIAAAKLRGIRIEPCCYACINAYLALGKTKPLSVAYYRQARRFLEGEFEKYEDHSYGLHWRDISAGFILGEDNECRTD